MCRNIQQSMTSHWMASSVSVPNIQHSGSTKGKGTNQVISNVLLSCTVMKIWHYKCLVMSDSSRNCLTWQIKCSQILYIDYS